jgi:hypothetical protein
VTNVVLFSAHATPFSTDERQWTPEKQTIVNDKHCSQLTDHLDTSLDLERLRAMLVNEGYPVCISTDPGRFVSHRNLIVVVPSFINHHHLSFTSFSILKNRSAIGSSKR